MAWILQRAYNDRARGLIVLEIAQEIFDAQGARIGWSRGREFSWSNTDPRLYNAQGQLRPKRVIVDGIKAEIRTTLQAEAAAVPPEGPEEYPGAGEVI
jgi:hypothetical protein